jgi:hypothetical protein
VREVLQDGGVDVRGLEAAVALRRCVQVVDASDHEQKEQELPLGPRQAEALVVHLQIDGRRAQHREQGPQPLACEFTVPKCPAQGEVHRRAPERVDRVDARSTLDQRFYQLHVAGLGGHHQRSHPEHAPVFESVARDFEEDLRGLSRVMRHGALSQRRSDVFGGPGRPVAGSVAELVTERPQAVKSGKLVQALLGLVEDASRGERFLMELAKLGPIDHRPWHRREAEDPLADQGGLFNFALKLEPARLLLPVFERRLLRAHLGEVLAAGDLQKPEQVVARVRFDDVERVDSAREGDVERVDEELVDFERLVSLVFRARVGELFRIRSRRVTPSTISRKRARSVEIRSYRMTASYSRPLAS